MSQQDVVSFLRENKGKWFKSKEIADHCLCSVGSIITNLRRLRDQNNIEFRTIKTNMFEYRFKK